MTTPVFKLKNDHGATIGHVRELYAKVVQEFTQKISTGVQDMGGFFITNLPDLSNDFSVGLLGDPEGTYAVRKRWIRENFTTIADNELKLSKTGGTMTGNLTLVHPTSDLHATTKLYVDGKIAAVPQPDLTPYATKTYVDSQDSLKSSAATTYTKTETDTALGLKSDKLTTYTKIEVSDALALKSDKLTTYTKIETDTAVGMKANQSTTYTKTDMDASLLTKAEKANTYTKTETDTSLGLKADKITTYTKTETDTLFTGKKNTGTFDTKIQHSTTNSCLDCSAVNQIDVKVNGANRGYFFQPTGQSTTPLGLYSNDKLQLQSALSSSSVYGSKPLSSVATDVNTHALYVSGTDDVSKNVQSIVQVFQGTATGTLSTGHMNLGAGQQNFTSLSADSSLLLSGGTPLADPQLQLYSTTKATSLATNLPIQSTSKMGYASTTAITEANQFASKAYVDTQDATKLSLYGGTMTGDIVLKGVPTLGLHPATKSYVDSALSGIVIPDPDLTPYLPKSGGTMSGPIVLSGAPTSDLEASTKKYVDDGLQNVTGLVDKNQTDGAVYKLDVDNNRVNFYRGGGSDKYLEIFGGSNETNSTVTLSGNRNIMRLPTLGQNSSRSEWQFSCGTEVANGAPFTSNGIFRIIAGSTPSGQTFNEIVASKLTGDGNLDGQNTSIILFPRQTGSALMSNFIAFRDGAGYSTDADYGTQDRLSILSREQNDARYELKGEGGGSGGYAGDLLSEAVADPINIYLDNGTIRLRKNILDFMAFGEMAPLGNPFIRTVDRFDWEQQAMISSAFTPDKQLRTFSVLDQSSSPRTDYPQFIVEHNRNADLRLSTFNFGGAKTQLFMYPGGQTKTNHIEADRLIGYREDFSIQAQNDYSILPRNLSDNRYALKGEIPVLTPTKIYDVNMTAIVESSVSSQPQLILRTGTEDFLKIQRVSSAVTQITSNPLLSLRSNSLSTDYDVAIKSLNTELRMAVREADQTATITCNNSQIKFNDTQINSISFTGRPGLIPAGTNSLTDDNSFLTKAESVALFGTPGGTTDQAIFSSDGSFVSVSNPGTAVVQNGSNGKQIVLRSDLGIIYPAGGNSALNLFSKGTGLDVSGGALSLFGTSQTSGLTNIFTRAVGYDRDGEAMVSSRQFTHKAYVDGLASNYLASSTTLSQLGAPTTNVSMANNRLTNLADPSSGQDAATRAWVLQQFQTLGVSSYPSTYTIIANIGDVPSAVETLNCTGDKTSTYICASVTYSNQSPTQGFYSFTFASPPFGTGIYEVLLSLRSLRTGSPSTIDNDIAVPIVANRTSTGFQILMEETGTVAQNLAIVCCLIPSV